MKKLTVLVFAILLGSSQMFASDNNPSKDLAHEIRNQIIALLEKPVMEITEDMKASIEFMVNTKGEIVVLTVNSDDSIVENYVKYRLNYKKVITNPIGTNNKVFNISLKIRKSFNRA